MNKHFKCICLLLATVAMAQAKDPKSSETGNSYLFMSGKISAQVNDEILPVKAFDGKRFHFSGSDKTVRPAKDLSCAMIPVMVISNMFADISDLEYTFESNAEKLQTLWAINEMEAEQMRFEAGVEFENSLGGLPNQRPAVTDADKAAMALDDLTNNQIEDEIRESGLSKYVDTIRGKCSIVSDRAIENAYSALVLSFVQAGGEKDSEEIRRSIVRVVPVGDLKAGVNKSLKFNCIFPELQVSSAKLDLFLFDGKSKYVATNLSRGLREITPEQLQKLRDLEKQNKAEKAAENS